MVTLFVITILLIVSCGGNANKKQTDDAPPPEITTLTVKEIVVNISQSIVGNREQMNVQELKVVDEKENAVSLLFNNRDKWFENAIVIQSVMIPEGTHFGYNPGNNDSGGYFFLNENEILQFEFKVNDNIYPVRIGVGSKFVVQESTVGKYTLLPEETAKLSPEPVISENQ
jgi:hypothetical protein